MTAKEYLSQYLEANRDINDKLEEITRLRALACKTTQSLTPDKVQTSTTNKTETIVSKIVDMESEVDAEIDQLQETRRKVVQAINTVTEQYSNHLLRYFYVFGWGTRKIARFYKIHPFQVSRDLKKAEEIFQELYQEA